MQQNGSSQNCSSDYNPSQKESEVQKHKSKRYQKRQKVDEYQRQPKLGQWSQKQEKFYLQFLLKHQGEFELPRKRNIYKKMSKFLARRACTQRTYQQCRGHHQKKIKRLKNVKQIIAHYNILYQKDQNIKKQPEPQVKEQDAPAVHQAVDNAKKTSISNYKARTGLYVPFEKGNDQLKTKAIYEDEQLKKRKLKFTIKSEQIVEW